MASLPEMLATMWGPRAPQVAEEYSSVTKHKLFMADIAIFCNAAGPIQGATEYDRGVEEGKRRVWLQLARVAGLQHDDFIPIANGDHIFGNQNNR